MNRITEFPLAGNRYPLNFSVKAAKAIDEKYGSLNNLKGVFGWDGISSALENCQWALRLLLEQGEIYQRLLGETPIPVPDLEVFEVLIGARDVPRMQQAILEAIGLGMEPTVEVEPEEKNGEATQGQ